jgi:hypothetical protein
MAHFERDSRPEGVVHLFEAAQMNETLNDSLKKFLDPASYVICAILLRRLDLTYDAGITGPCRKSH